MQMHLIISVLFTITVFFAFLEDRLKEVHKICILAAYAIVMVLIATTKSVQGNADGASYEFMFYDNSNLLIELATEPTYIYLSRMVLACGGTIVTMFFRLVPHEIGHFTPVLDGTNRKTEKKDFIAILPKPFQ